MDTMTVLLILSVTLVVFTSIFLSLYLGRARSKSSPLQQTPQKEASSPQIASDFRAFNSSKGWQQSGRNFDSPSLPSQTLPGQLPSQMLPSHMNTNNSRTGWSSPLYNPMYAEAKPQITASGNRSVEHYEQCIHVFYEPRIDGISLVFKNTVITNAIEVDNVFTVCERKFKEVMRARGWERVGWIADLGEYNLVGTEATALVGESLKLFLDKFGLKTKGGLYLIAHYSSKAAPPDQETLNEKLKRIQFITAGVINKFQGNVFDTREEAIAFYLRLRQELLAGR